MCGILYAKVKSNLKNDEIFKSSFIDALDLMSYRGPDAKGIEVINNHYFGHVRLSIVDLNETSNQPYQDNDCLMIFNGEIYNFKELDPSSNSDTKTLFSSMKTMENPFQKLRGMFAFGWFDKKNENISFYRDFFGEKPLYYYSDNEIDIVSSTIKSIVHLVRATGKELKLNIDKIKKDFFLFGYLREPSTIWENISAVPPGHRLHFNEGKVNIDSLFFDVKSSNFLWNKSHYIKNTFISTDVPGTLLLSGGIDSTFLLANAFENKISLHLGIYKANDPLIDESPSALDNISKMKLNQDQFPINVLSGAEIEKLDIDGFVKILEQPSSAGLQVFHLLEHLKGKQPNLKLVYTGLGGDELFGGYPTFYNFKKINFLIHIPFIEYFLPAIKRFKVGKKMLKSWDADIYSFLYRINFKMFRELFSNDEKLEDIYKEYRFSLNKIPKELLTNFQKNPLSDIKKNEMFQYGMNQLIRDNDNIAMHFGLESRSPLLNPDWYNQKPDKKFRLKNVLKLNYNIQFGKKKGFTLDEPMHKKVYIDYINLNKKYLEPIEISERFNFAQNNVAELRTLAILCGWLKYNYSIC